MLMLVLVMLILVLLLVVLVLVLAPLARLLTDSKVQFPAAKRIGDRVTQGWRGGAVHCWLVVHCSRPVVVVHYRSLVLHYSSRVVLY